MRCLTEIIAFIRFCPTNIDPNTPHGQGGFMRTRIEGALSIAAVAVFLSIGSPAVSQTKKPTTLAELAAYTGADREQLLLAGARSEGKVVWYTSLAGASFKEPMKAFEAKYPASRWKFIDPRAAIWERGS